MKNVKTFFRGGSNGQGCAKYQILGVGDHPPRLSQNLAGLLGKKQIHLGGGSLSAGIQVLRWESLVSIMSKQGTIKTKRKERFLFFIAKRVCLLQNVNIFLFVKTFY